MTSRKQPGVAFWATVVVVVVALYVTSFGPVCWITSRMKWYYGDELGALYRPLLWLWVQDRRVGSALAWYSSLAAAPNWNWLGDNWSD